ncbi:hypothetical protein PtA15_7A68 [Puccinia triticina]|uniref:Uncharacterized protein n=1 Tax=Puccinia triticina TaxID=208348 RepID=A0ABY7CQT3_9BASI|nr:uncharacterized protein PtA15_7A68 [Puccinia triticina]WAQ86342.1 hypothetical protein PtA15_7A68 [Puccinia triticina]WAR56221.1 hypothetical protein PtB15_7B66 [Puccinia triticina]
MVLPATLSALLAQPIPPPAVAPPAPLSAMLVQTRLAPQMAPRLPPWPAVGPSRTPRPPPAYSSQPVGPWPLEVGSSLPRALRPRAKLSLHASSPTRPRRRPPLSLCKPRRRPRRRDPLRISRILPPLRTGHVTVAAQSNIESTTGPPVASGSGSPPSPREELPSPSQPVDPEESPAQPMGPSPEI